MAICQVARTVGSLASAGFFAFLEPFLPRAAPSRSGPTTVATHRPCGAVQFSRGRFALFLFSASALPVPRAID